MIYLIILLGLVLRLISLNQSFWLDEATSAIVVRDLSFSEIITKFSSGDFHPPLYYLFLKLWSYPFGYSEIALRLPSVIFGLATIFLIYLITKEFTKDKWGVPGMATLLLSTSGLHIYYSQEARMYALTTLLVTSLVYFFIKKRWALFSLFLLLVGMADYPALLVIPIFWILGWQYRRKLAITHLPLVIFYVFWLPIFLQQFTAGFSTLESNWWKVLGLTSLKNLILVPVKFMLGRISFDNQVIYGIFIAVSSLVFAYPILSALKNSRKTLLFWLWLLLPIATTAVLSLKIPMLSYFRLLFVLPAFYLLVSFGLAKLKSPVQQLLFLALILTNLLTSGYYLFNPSFHREDWRKLVSFVESVKKGNSITIFVADANMEAYRYYAADAKMGGPEGLAEDFDQVWLMRYVQPIFDPGDRLRQKVEKAGYVKEAEYDFNGVVVWRYENRN